jgi:ABC-type transport system involved in Fe-S cluster assembly fused permease/ATPase subunit
MPTHLPESAMVVAFVGAFFNILRFAVDLIKVAARSEQERENALDTTQSSSSVGNSSILGKNRFGFSVSMASLKSNRSRRMNATKSLIINGNVNNIIDDGEDLESVIERSPAQRMLSLISVLFQFGTCAFFLSLTILMAKKSPSTPKSVVEAVYSEIPLGATAVGSFFGLLLAIRDYKRERFTSVQRMFSIFSTSITMLGCIVLVANPPETSNDPTTIDHIVTACLIALFLLSLAEAKVFDNSAMVTQAESATKKVHLGRGLLIILKPYFWPGASATSACLNRTRAILTWFCVAGSKGCSLASPIFLGRASTALARFDYSECGKNAIIFSLFQFSSSFLKECQSLVYLKVAQAAFVQLSEVSFYHLHSLSLDWHLKKKLGEVIRSMDRGILACDILMKYLFLWLFPAVLECILVCIIFASYFNYLPLALTIFTFVFLYMVWTIIVTLWRKKFRKSVAKSDNDWHDRCTDSLVNFETVKFFTAEKYEMERFSESVKKYQSSSVDVQASLSFLNITQMLMMQSCLAISLILATNGIRERFDCCLDNGCESNGLIECCASQPSCEGMEIGDFVAVLTYTLNLFGPLQFLGSVYNAIVMAMVDLRNLSELLAEEPDLVDAADAVPLPKTNADDSDVAVEFDNVAFRYPSQAEGMGLTGVSFKMMRGTTTAIVGSTGAGKTTISRLLFRFYDVCGGAVKVNGKDVRTVTQKSLREMIGVVPQATSLFNDTIKANVLYGKRDATDEDLDRVANSAQLVEFIRALPDGWESMVGDRGLKLSGGEKQRTAIARCLLKDPPFVLLDEATSALDTLTENSIQQALDILGAQRTCLVIAHRLGTICRADNIIVLGDGVVLEQGTHDELLAKNGKYAEMWNMQLHSTGKKSDSSSSLDKVGDE